MEKPQTVDQPKHIVVIGAGTMGVDIAAAFLAGGWAASLVEPRVEGHALAKSRLDHSLSMLGGGCRAASFFDSMAKVSFASISHGLVIEAVPESLPLKQRVFAELSERVPGHIPLCSNSSAIPIGEIGRGLAASPRMVGTHFFMPAHLVPGVEVVSSSQTNPAIAERVADDLRSAGRVPIMVRRDIPGFLVNRLQHALSREAFHLIDEGIATAADIDAAVRFGFGFRYLAAGPCLQRDHAGLDIHYAAGCSIYPDLCNDAKPAKALKDKVDAGHYGMKVGQGFRKWDEESINAERQRYEGLLLAAARLLEKDIAHASNS
ncbi:MAG: 3-hydroxyacyl-CoA dehydrogenase NAD-binding domain-containing protein, partial [Burkholderiaceae bacterium]|nr:3-hydroxyacyl-CoA dehydrogenase NAD-binding domain-containing protein [Burkholderiaceae bacterium]